MKCNVCGNVADVEINLNTNASEKPVWYGICFDCEDNYRTFTDYDRKLNKIQPTLIPNINCPHCGVGDCVALEAGTAISGRSLVFWCCNGHVYIASELESKLVHTFKY
jgi:hypothetical protein